METMTRTPKPHDDYYLGWILKIAAATNVKLTESTLAVYLERLRQLSGEQIKTAATRTIEEWAKPSMMPPLPFILERMTRFTGVPNAAVVTRENYRAQLEAADERDAIQALAPAFKRSGFTPTEVAEMIEAGKQAQREHIAKLAEDPEWQKLHEQFGRPGLSPQPVRTFESEEAKQQWARDTAKAQGWAK